MNSAQNVLDSNAHEYNKMFKAFNSSKNLANTIQAVNSGDNMQKITSLIQMAAMAMGG